MLANRSDYMARFQDGCGALLLKDLQGPSVQQCQASSETHGLSKVFNLAVFGMLLCKYGVPRLNARTFSNKRTRMHMGWNEARKL